MQRSSLQFGVTELIQFLVAALAIEEKNRIQISKQQLEATIKRLYKNVDRKSIQEKGIHTPAMDESKYQIIEEDKTVSENPV